MLTDEFFLTIGVNEGYRHNNETIDPVYAAIAAWSVAAEAEYLASGIYPSAIVSAGKSVYRQEWGCPDGGEAVVTLTGTRNPEFAPDATRWKVALRATALAAGKTLGQTVVYLRFAAVDFEYLKPLIDPQATLAQP